MEINVRKGIREDYDQMFYLWKEGLCDTYEFVHHLFTEERLKTWKRKLLQCKSYVAEADRQMVGFIAVYQTDIHGIFVHRDYRSIGIGKALMTSCKRDYDVLNMHLYSAGNRAYRFCERENFIITGAAMEPEFSEMEYFMSWNSSAAGKAGR